MQNLCNTFNPLSNISSTQFFYNNVNYVIFNYVIQDQNSTHKTTAVHFRTYLPAIICVSLKRLHAKASNYHLSQCVFWSSVSQVNDYMCNYAIHKKQKRYVSSIIKPIIYSMVCLHNVFKCLLANKNELTKEYLKSKIKGYLKRNISCSDSE